MKKHYQKPELFYENFALTEAIAACTVKGGPNSPENCSYYDEDLGLSLFVMGVSPTCELTPSNYDAGAAGNLIFGS